MSFLPNVPQVGDQYEIGGSALYVVEVDASGQNSTSGGWGYPSVADDRIVITLHDNEGSEVEVRLPHYDDDDD